MSMNENVRKLGQSFITLDDVVLGQCFVEGGFSQLARLGFSASGPLVALNVAARAVCLGAEVGTRSVDKAADTVTGIMPLADETKALAGKMGSQVKALAECCSMLAIRGIELAGGKAAQDPFTKQEWLAKKAPQGYTSAELAADTAFGTLPRLAAMPISLGMEMIQMATGGSIGDALRRTVDASNDAAPGGSEKIKSTTLREGLVSVGIGSGLPVVQSTIALIEAAARLAFTDSRAMHRVLSSGLQQARLLADQERKEVVSGVPVSALLRKSAAKVAGDPPEAFLAALERGPAGEQPGPGTVLEAMLKDSRALLTFFTFYPQILGLLGSDLSLLLADGLADVRGAEASVEDEEEGLPAAFNLLDTLVGTAVTAEGETPLFARATVYLAQDLSYGVYRDLHGREAALDRAERLFGEGVRERLAADVSLDTDILAEKSHRDRGTRLRAYIRGTSDANALSRQTDLCYERLALLETSQVRDTPLLGRLSRRVEILRTFTSLAAGNLALRGAKESVDTQARREFYAWASQQKP